MAPRLTRLVSSFVVLLFLPVALASANPTHDALAKLPAGERNQLLTAFMQKSGEACAVTSSFFQGFDSQQSAYWNVRCANGRAFIVRVHNDAKGSTRIMDCALQKMLGGECFKKFGSSWKRVGEKRQPRMMEPALAVESVSAGARESAMRMPTPRRRAGMRIAFQGSDRAQLAEFILQKVA